MAIFPIKAAAQLADASYTSTRITKPKLLMSCPDRDVQAHILEGDILLLPGSNSVKDYLRYNLRVLNLGNTRLTMNDPGNARGASGTIWHQGFLAYSLVIFNWLASKNVRPKFIIGHSLGAAAAQILSKSYAAPGIGFAAPRPKKVRGHVRNGNLCLILNRVDDIVPSAVPGYSHMGPVKILSPARRRGFPAHSMRRYLEVIDEMQSAGTLQSSWPG